MIDDERYRKSNRTLGICDRFAMFVSQPVSCCEPVACQSLSQVESNEYCRKILRRRMAENLVPRGVIEEDVVTVKPPPNARGVGGGFPCQACSVCRVLHKVCSHSQLSLLFFCGCSFYQPLRLRWSHHHAGKLLRWPDEGHGRWSHQSSGPHVSSV